MKTRENKEYQIWIRMRIRCYNPNCKDYPDYGGRGIRVCERWRYSFVNFLEDMGRCPPNRSINRIGNDGDYEPNNCEWATAKKQANNKRNNVLLTVDGLTLNISQWTERTGLKKGVILKRKSLGWSDVNCVKTPGRKKRTPIFLTVDGLTLTISQWAERTGLKKITIRRRKTFSGWPDEACIKTPLRYSEKQ